MVRTFRYPLHPTATQEGTLLGWIGQCCDLANGAIQERRTAYARDKTSVGLHDQQRSLTEWRQSDPDAADVPVWVQRSALRRVDLAFKAFFRRCKVGEKPGYPRFRSKRRYDSFTVPAQGRIVSVEGDRVSLPKLPGLKFHEYRPLRGRVLTVTVRRDSAGSWWVLFACDLGVEAPPKVAPVSYVGVDVGLHALATLSDPAAEPIENPRHGRRSAAKLARAQRVLARRKRGSRSRERARVQVAKCYRRQANQRRDTAWKAAKALVQKYDVIVHERLVIAKMVHGKLAKSIYDAGWGLLLRAIACKAEEAGKWCVAVDPHGTSQGCSRCGATVAKGLSVRIHRCPFCGLVMCRDQNAAANIEARGRRAVTELLAAAA